MIDEGNVIPEGDGEVLEDGEMVDYTGEDEGAEEPVEEPEE